MEKNGKNGKKVEKVEKKKLYVVRQLNMTIRI